MAEQDDKEDFDLEKARFDVHKFGIKGFEKSKYEDARVALAVSLGAKVTFPRRLTSLPNALSPPQPPKRKFINYRELVEQNRAKKVKDKEEAENVSDRAMHLSTRTMFAVGSTARRYLPEESE